MQQKNNQQVYINENRIEYDGLYGRSCTKKVHDYMGGDIIVEKV